MSGSLQDRLGRLVADHHVLYQKLRAFHWTVQGPAFFRLHEIFEGLYNDAAETGDAIAERMLAKGAVPPLTMRAMLEASQLEEAPEGLDAMEMVQAVVADLGAVNESMRAAAREAEQAGDVATMNLLDGKADEREKTIWMLRAFAGGR